MGNAETIQLHHVSKTYGAGTSGIAALKDVTLHLGRGEFTAIIGKSGSGKSTFSLRQRMILV